MPMMPSSSPAPYATVISSRCNQAGQDTKNSASLRRQRRFVSHELANSKRRLTGLIDLKLPEFKWQFPKITTARPLRPDPKLLRVWLVSLDFHCADSAPADCRLRG